MKARKPTLEEVKQYIKNRNPLGLSGAVVGEGDSCEEALGDVRSAILAHIEAFGAEALDAESPVLEAFVAEATVSG